MSVCTHTCVTLGGRGGLKRRGGGWRRSARGKVVGVANYPQDYPPHPSDRVTRPPLLYRLYYIKSLPPPNTQPQLLAAIFHGGCRVASCAPPPPSRNVANGRERIFRVEKSEARRDPTEPTMSPSDISVRGGPAPPEKVYIPLLGKMSLSKEKKTIA